MSEAPAVDVLMTVFNGARYLADTIASLQAQTLRNFHFHVVDDGSTDDSAAIIAAAARADKRLRLYRKPNGGVVESSNYGLKFCTAEFVARLDADDLCYPDRLEHQVGYLKTHPGVLAVAGKARHIDSRGHRIGTIAKFASPDLADPDNVPALEPYLLHPFVTLRRSAVDRVGGYRHLSVAEDSDLFWRLQEKGSLYNADHFSGEYRMNPESLSSRSVQSGRVMAVFSQLAALSAKRRRSGQDDINFNGDYSADIKAAASSLEEICYVAERQLHSAELDHFEFSVGVKLLEMADYRPYELERSDCVFLRERFPRGLANLSGPNREVILRSYPGSAARLAADGRWGLARALCPPELERSFWPRYALRKLLPPAAHRRARRWAGPALSLIRKQPRT